MTIKIGSDWDIMTYEKKVEFNHKLHMKAPLPPEEVPQHATQLNISYGAWEYGPNMSMKYAIGTVHELEGKKFRVVKHVKSVENQYIKVKMLEVIINPHTGKDMSITTVGGVKPYEPLVYKDGPEPWMKIKATGPTYLDTTTAETVVEFTPKTEREKMFDELIKSVTA